MILLPPEDPKGPARSAGRSAPRPSGGPSALTALRSGHLFETLTAAEMGPVSSSPLRKTKGQKTGREKRSALYKTDKTLYYAKSSRRPVRKGGKAQKKNGGGDGQRSYLGRPLGPSNGGAVTGATCCLTDRRKLTRHVWVWPGLVLQWQVGAQVGRIFARLTWSVYPSINPPAF